MLDTISFITNQSVEEALFIEQIYLGSLFDNEEFVKVCAKVCSLSHIISSFQNAKQSNDHVFLEQMRSAHRTAREFLNDPELKGQIKEIVLQRKANMERRAYWNMFHMMVQLVQQFPRGNFSRHLSKLLPGISNNLPTIEDGDVSNSIISLGGSWSSRNT
jgi:hypothetical protein